MKGFIRIEQAPVPDDLPEDSTLISGLMVTSDCELTAMERWTAVQQLAEALHFTERDWAEVIAMAFHAGPYAGLGTDQYEIGIFKEVQDE